MLIYLLKSIACLAILLLFYKLLLEKENMHGFKRFYLIGSLVLALIIPAIVFTEYIEVAPSTFEVGQEMVMVNPDSNIQPALASDISDIAPLLWGVYFMGMLFFGIKFFKNLFQIFRRIRRNPKYIKASFTRVLLQEKIPPHTFFRYIFLNKSKFEANKIPKEVLLHEETHAKQKHSLDVVFVELLQVVLWVNPLIHFFKKAIKLNHEFLADSAVLNNNVDSLAYQNTLLSFLSSKSAKKYQPTLPNAINYSSIKKRFKVMKSQTSKKSVFLRSVLLLPLLALLVYGFSGEKVIPIESKINNERNLYDLHEGATSEQMAEYNALAKKYNAIAIEQRKIPLSELNILETVFRRMTDSQKKDAQPFPECPQDGATKEQVSEYNALAKKYNFKINAGENIWIKKGDVERLEYLHNLMSEEQRANAEPFPDFPEPPEPPMPPNSPDEEEIIKMEREVERQEKTMKEQELAMREQERNMEEQELEMERQEMAMEKKEIEMERQQRVMKEQEVKVERLSSQLPQPPPPPTPESPLDHVIEMAKKGATFYYEGKKISSDKAIEIIKNNNEINIHSTGSKSKNPEVRLSTKPIKIGFTPNSREKTNSNLQKVALVSLQSNETIERNKIGKRIIEFSKNFRKCTEFYFDGQPISENAALHIYINDPEIEISKDNSNGKRLVAKC